MARPPLEADDPRSERGDPRYAKLAASDIPLTECLKDTVDRVMPCWNAELAPAILAGKQLLVSAHGNSIRALVKHLEDISDDAITELNIPTGNPLVYELDADLRPTGPGRYLDPEAAAAGAAEVAGQAG